MELSHATTVWQNNTGGTFFGVRTGIGDAVDDLSAGTAGDNLFAALFRGDLDLADGSTSYILFPDKSTGVIAASDLII